MNENLELYNHLFPVARAQPGELPTTAQRQAILSHVHDQHLHEVEGQPCYALPVDETVAFLVANKDDPAARDPVECMLHKRGVLVSTYALQQGATEPADILTIDQKAGRISTDVGKLIIPLDINWAAKIIGFHHGMKGRPRDLIQPNGGLLSVTALEKFEQFLVEVVGVRPNHEAIQAHPRFCFNCQKREAEALH